MKYVDVYGQDHSPWVQAVLLGVHEKGVSHTLVTAPPWQVFRRWGIMMPAARVDGSDWQLESQEILQQLGFEPVSDEDMGAIRRAWQGFTHRPKSAFGFFQAFSLAGDKSPGFAARLYQNFARSFGAFYFFLLISFLNLSKKLTAPADFADQFLPWEARLAAGPGPFLGGDAPGSLDLFLFAMVQTHCTIRVPPLKALQEDPRLGETRKWIGYMQARFSDYPHLYSGPHFEPGAPQRSPATRIEQVTFWTGWLILVIAFPITVLLVFVLAVRVRGAPPVVT